MKTKITNIAAIATWSESENKLLTLTDVEILVEDQQKSRWRGRTPDNRLVFFELDENHCGSLANIRITRTGPYSLFGEFE